MRHNFRVTAEHDNYTELTPEDRRWHDETSPSSFDSWDLDRESVVRSPPFPRSVIRSWRVRRLEFIVT